MSSEFRARRMLDRLRSRLEQTPLPEADRRQVAGALARALDVRIPRVDHDHDHRLLHPGRTLLILLDDAGCTQASLLVAGVALETRFPEMALPPEILEALPAGSGRWWAEQGGWETGEPREPARESAPSAEESAPSAEESARPAGESVPLPDPAPEFDFSPLDPGWDARAGGEPTPGGTVASSPDPELLERLVTLPPGPLLVVLAEALDQLRHLHTEEGRPALARGAALAAQLYVPLSRRVAESAPVLARRWAWWGRRVGQMASGG